MSALIGLHLTYLRAAGRAASTIVDRQRILETADRALPYGVDIAAPEEIADWLANPDWGAWTRATYYHHLAGFYRWAAAGADPYISFDPTAELIAPRNPESVPNPVTDEQLALALARSPLNWTIAITLAAYAGLRAGEVQRIRREDVTAAHLTIWHGKGDKTKTLPTHEEIWRVVEHRPPGLLVTNQRGNKLDIHSRQAFHFRRIGLPEVHMHRFRHWFGTKLLRSGADIRTVQLLMRHSSLRTTQGYLEITDEQLVTAVTALPALIPTERAA